MSLNKIILLCVLFVSGFFLRKVIFPSDFDLISQQISTLSEVLSTKTNESIISRANKISELVEIFSLPLVAEIELEEFVKTQLIQTKSDLKEQILLTNHSKSLISTSVSELQIKVDGPSATSQMILRIDMNSTGGSGPTYELFQVQLQWVKQKGSWLIKEIFIRPG